MGRGDYQDYLIYARFSCVGRWTFDGMTLRCYNEQYPIKPSKALGLEEWRAEELKRVPPSAVSSLAQLFANMWNWPERFF